MKEITEQEAEVELKRGAKDVTEEDLKRVLDKKDAIEDKFKDDSPLSKFLADTKDLFSFIHDYTKGVHDFQFISIFLGTNL